MKKKVKTILFVFIIIGVVILNITYKNKNEVTKTKRKKQNNLAIMIKEDGASDYTKSSSKDIPKGSYALNRDKSYCKNNGVIGDYDNTLGKISFSFIGTDNCYLYFDVITDTEKPVISNLTINDTTITATLTDNESLSGYGISTSNSIEPTSWTTISGTTYNLSTTITTEGTYYLWVKDSAGNISISISIEISLGPYGWETILINNGNGATTTDGAISYIKGKGTPNFSTIATSNMRMYAAADDLGTSYYFRGAVDNNWVKYGKYTKDMYNCNNGTISATDTGNSCTKIASSGDDIYWRIIRINGDGSIRMIYSGITPPTESTKVIKAIDTSLGNSPFNANRDKAEYVGYMFTVGQQHGTGTDSTIKTYLEDWYANYTDLNKTGTQITDQIFCNDRTASTSAVAYSTTNYTTLPSWNSTGTTYYYGVYGRIVKDNNPMLTCAVDSDRFTVNKIKGKGNSALTYPIGLVTIDELEMAGNNWSESNTSYYLHTGAYYWAGSPDGFDDGSSYVFGVDGYGRLGSNRVNDYVGVRGVVSLSSKAKLSGSGTYNDVYTVN